MTDLGSRERAGDDARADTLTRAPGDAPPQEPIDWTGRDKDKDHGPLSFLKELPVLIVVAFVLALLIKTFLVQAFYIPSESMLPTLEVGDRVLVNKVVYHLHPPRRGDIIVFAEPHPTEAQQERGWWGDFTHWLTDGLGFTQDPTKDYIKRVIALPGETVEVREGQVLIDGRPIDEPYLSEIEDVSTFPPHKVPEGTLFVMGDNRTNSQDSRSLLGDIPMDKVVGKAFVVIWPPGDLRWLPGSP